MNNDNLEIVIPTAIESIERANIDMQIATAKRYPRSLATVKKRMMDLATLDRDTAASCFYRLNRQGKMIEGPTIRLAEIAGSSFGNLRYGARVISNDEKVITAQGYCFDLETNVMSQVEVQRRITDRNGNKYSDDMQVVTGNAACAIAARNAIFKVVPFAFIKPIFTAAKKTAVGDIKTLVERRTQILKTFAALGVSEKRILATLGKSGVEEIGLDELEALIGLHNAIEDKEQTIEEAFPTVFVTKPIIEKKVSGSGAAAASEDNNGGAQTEVNPQSASEKPSPKAATRKVSKSKVTDSPSAAQSNYTRLLEFLHIGHFTGADFLAVAHKKLWIPKRIKKLEQVPDPDLSEFLQPDSQAIIMEELEKMPRQTIEI